MQNFRKRLIEWFTSPNGFRRLLNFYAPYFGAGVKVRKISKDFRDIRVSMKLKWYNQNYVGVHFGGSMYSMIDPFYMLMLMKNLGPDYIVWDKSAEIEFVSPGRGEVSAHFQLTEAMLQEALDKTANGDKFLPTYDVSITDADGNIVAKARKTLYIRKKKPE